MQISLNICKSWGKRSQYLIYVATCLVTSIDAQRILIKHMRSSMGPEGERTLKRGAHFIRLYSVCLGTLLKLMSKLCISFFF